MTLLNKWEAQGNVLFRYRGSLPVLIILPALYLMYRKPEDLMPFGIFFGPVLCYLISLAGLLIRCYTVGYSARNTSGRNTAEGQIADVVNTTGIYSICRHPLYIGNFLMWLGIALLTAHVWFILFFVALYILYYERIMFAEERYLEKKFGIQYTQWADHTPAIFPHFQRWQPNRNSFSLKKVWS
ncbi:MAG: methyltransferase family protein, partial [Chitinophagaceae bacterium]